jgi:hypothetical protein
MFNIPEGCCFLTDEQIEAIKEREKQYSHTEESLKMVIFNENLPLMRKANPYLKNLYEYVKKAEEEQGIFKD